MRRIGLLALWIVASVGLFPIIGVDTARAEVRVDLINPGRGPREALRLEPVAGTRTTGTMTMSIEIDQSGVTSAHVTQTTEVVFSTVVNEVAPDGTFEMGFTYDTFELIDANGTDAQRAQVQELFDQFAGLTGTYSMTATGQVTESSFELPDLDQPAVEQLLQQLLDQADQLAIPFPEERVGEGARWRSTTRLEAGGINVRQTYTYTLVSRDDTGIELGVKYVQTAKRGQAELPGVPPDVDVTITEYKVRGSGSANVDLTIGFPNDSQTHASGRQAFRLDDGSDSGSLVQDIELDVGCEVAA